MFGLQIVDIIVILAYFAAMLFIGFRAMKNIRNQEDYFLGGRRFGKLVQTFAAFGQGTSADHAVGTTTTTYNNGAGGIWSALLLLWATPIYWFTSPWYRRLRILTLGDFFEERYGSKRMAGFYSIIASLFLMALIAVGMKAVSATVIGITQKEVSELNSVELAEYNEAIELENLTELKAKGKLDALQEKKLEGLELRRPRKEFSYISENIIMWTVCSIIFIYAIAGGLEAALYTDTIQGMCIIVLSIMLIPFGLAKISSINGVNIFSATKIIHETLPESYFDIFGSPKAIDFTWYYIAAVSVLATVNVAVQANQLNAIGSAKDELTARIGFTTGSFMKRFCTVFWGFFALVAIVLYSDSIENSDYVWGYATKDLLGGLNLGLVGLMIACLLAALMSTADMMMITASGILTHNLYRPLLPNCSEAHYVKVGRVLGGLVLVGGTLLAAGFDTILQILKFIWEFNAILAAAFWCGMKWRGANRKGAWSSMIVTMLFFAMIPVFVPIFVPALRHNSYLLKRTAPKPITRIYIARQMDVKLRNQEIEEWGKLASLGKDAGPKPEPLEYGQKMERIIQPPKKSLFWSKGIREVDGKTCGQGLLYVEMIMIDQFFDLSRNPYALNETIRTILRIIIPFLMIILVSFLTKPDDKKRLARFFVKMRTPVLLDREKDSKELELSYANPERFRERLLWPDSGLEFFKWSKTDAIGFCLSVLCVFGVLGLLYLVLNIGA